MPRLNITIVGRSLIKSITTTSFTPLEIRGLTDLKSNIFSESTKPEIKEPLHSRFAPSLDWTNIWPAAATFHYSTVPFPIRQGYCKNRAENDGVSPGSYANAELMKIPNFLHLTKRHIKKHCDAIRGLCTKWPKGLDDEKSILKYYPVEVVQRNYVFSSSNIRDPRARTAELSVPVSCLSLSEHGKNKLIRLTMGPGPGRNMCRYDWNHDMLHIFSDRCPTSRQNADFLLYVLTVLTLECRKVEHWEEERTHYDWLQFDWFSSVSRTRLLTYAKQTSSTHVGSRGAVESDEFQTKSDLPMDHDPIVGQYRQALQSVWRSQELLHSDQWSTRPDPPRKRRCVYPPIRSQPFQPLTGLDDAVNVKEYRRATRQLFGLNS